MGSSGVCTRIVDAARSWSARTVVMLGGPTHQEDIPRGEGLVAEPGHQGIDGRCGVGARHRDGHHARVRVTNHR
ncbi:hypothetical protein J113_03845 [Mycobacterium tuberculosis CAS/NITR204]|uniref:Uncharacterized protein n=1 Tax=Mycobacterium tuberculosis CAS/NITR204 TaxID=1310114 RepID=R4MDI9_MYCTX|nr:hypothetical protein J113_03845 [Mycobacterium tuberculosis CAS/NITR204]